MVTTAVELTRRIHSEFSGHMQDALLHIARRFEADGDGILRDAEMLEAAMAGMGTKDERL
jgi:annexin A7/11